MPTRNINLTDHYDRFVEENVTSGRYQNASEVVRAGLRLLEQREQEDALKLEHLRDAIQAGFDDIERGDARTVEAGQLGSHLDELETRAVRRPTSTRTGR